MTNKNKKKSKDECNFVTYLLAILMVALLIIGAHTVLKECNYDIKTVLCTLIDYIA